LLDLCVVAIPLAASFYHKAPFYKEWKDAGIGLLVTVLFFVVWDEMFTRMGIWGFNERYLTGVYLGSLPLEEVLFFICIPYACLFTYFSMKHLIRNDYLLPYHGHISAVLIVVLTGLGSYHITRLYTALAFLLLAAFLLVQRLLKSSSYMGRFYFAFLILLIPFFLVNGILTGWFTEAPVVLYNDKHTLGIRLGTIPLEDVFYGMLLMVIPIGIWEWRAARRV
jgi:lycopene cyclase domain-containing protein